MTTSSTDHTADHTPQRDLLLTRVMDGRASADEWDAFRALASRDPSAWADLQAMQRDHEHLTAEVDRALARAELVALPDPLRDPAPAGTATRPIADHDHPNDHTHRFERRASGVAKWLGWGVAAMVAISWFAGSQGGPTTTLTPIRDPGTNRATLLPAWGEGTNAALEYYLTQGRETGKVVRELPDRPILQTTRNPDGTVEVLFLRQILERAVVDDVYRIARDEMGNPIPVPTQQFPTSRPPL